MSKIRTFIAVKVSSKIEASASRLISKLEMTGAGYNWVVDENLHITMNFVGDMRDTEVPEFCLEIKRVAEKHEPFWVEVAGTSGFPSAEQPRVIWIGITEGTDALQALHADLSEVLRNWGIPKEKNKYHPHVTLGRLRRGGRWNDSLAELLAKNKNSRFGSCSVDEIVVFSSHLDRLGPTYTPMSRIKLSGDGNRV